MAGDARFVQATQAQHGRHRHRHVQRPAARRGPRRRPVRRPTRGVQGFASGLFTDPNGDPVNGTAGAAAGPAAAPAGPDQGGAHRQPGRLPVRVVQRARRSPARRSTTTARRPATPRRRARRSPTSTRTTTRSCTTRWRTSCRSGTSATDRARMQVLALSTSVLGQGAGFVTAGSRAAALQVAGPQLVQLRRLVQPDPLGLRRRQRLRRAACRPAADNEDKWPYARPLLADPALVPGLRRGRRWPTARYRELLRIRASRRRCSACRTAARCRARVVPAVRHRGDARRDHHAARTAAAWIDPRWRR